MNKADDERAKLTVSISAKNVEALKALAKQTRIPQSRLIDEAIEDLIKKHGGGERN